MITILRDYFRALRAELRFWRRVGLVLLVAIPRAAMDLLREWMGAVILSWAIRILPQCCDQRQSLIRCLRWQRDYNRYRFWTLAAGKQPLVFEDWSMQRSWLDLRFRSMETV